MITNDELEIHPHPLRRAYQIQKLIESLEMDIAAARTELAQITIYCREKNKLTDSGYSIVVKTSTRHSVNPEKFKEAFPEANEHLVQLFVTGWQSDLKRIQDTGVLPDITVANALREVGKAHLYEKACDKHVSEKVTIVADSTA